MLYVDFGELQMVESKTEIERIDAELAALNEKAGEIAEDLNAETERAEAKEAQLHAEVETEKERAMDAEYEILQNVATLAGTVAQTVSNVAGKQDKLVAGSNITIEGNTISATGGGQGDSYDDTEIRGRIGDVEDDTAQLKSDLTDIDGRVETLEKKPSGAGTVKSVNGVQPNASGDVLLTDATLPAAALDVEARNGLAEIEANVQPITDDEISEIVGNEDAEETESVAEQIRTLSVRVSSV